MNDDVAEAIALHKKLAATRLVRRDELEAEIAALKDAGPSAALDERQRELAVVESEYRDALAEIRALQKLAATAPAGLEDTAPFERQTAEELALENARDHIRSLDAAARVGEELRPAPAQPSREEAEAAAHAEFEARRAAKDAECPVTPTRPKKTL
jgi:hypothetical protein